MENSFWELKSETQGHKNKVTTSSQALETPTQ